MDLLFKYTLSNDVAGDLEIKEPDGWDDARINLERNDQYHSLVESYRQPLTFDDAESISGLTGGMQYIKDIESTQGPDAIITLTIEISEDGGETYEVCFEGTIDFDTIKEIDFYKLECGVKRDDFWSKFINRKATPVNLMSTVDLDGNAIDLIDPITIPLTSQVVFQRHQSLLNFSYSWPEGDINDTDRYFQIDTDEDVIDEIQQNFSIPVDILTEVPFNLFTLQYDGSYAFNLRLEFSEFQRSVNGGCTDVIDVLEYTESTGGSRITLNVYIKINDGTPIEFTKTNYSSANPSINNIVGDYKSTVYTYQDTLELNKNDEIFIYGKIDATWPQISFVASTLLLWGKDGISEAIDITTYPRSGCDLSFIPTTVSYTFGKVPSETDDPTNFSIEAETVYPDTETEGFLIHEAGNAITDRIIGRDRTFYSEYLGSPNTQVQNYAEIGCGSAYALSRGLNVRGYSLTDKPFFMSFDTWWNGINPILNLGLGYEISANSPEEKIIRVEPKRYFYDPVPSVLLDFVNNIERTYDMNMLIKSIEIGYEKWSAESESGVDDPQSKRVYSTRFKTVGKDVKILSKFIAASLAIEQTRRNRVELGKDWRLDEEVMIIAVNLTGSPEYQPERDENFSVITDLLNSETRYNIRLSVARNFKRWINYFNGCLQWYESLSPAEQFKFASGEGNFDMTSTLVSGDCESGQSGEFVTLDNLADAVNLGTGSSWSIDSSPSVTVSSGFSKYLSIGLTGAEAGVRYSFTVDFTILSGNPNYVKAFLLDSGGNIISVSETLAEGENTFTLQGSDTPAYLAIEAYRFNVNPATVQIDSAVINVLGIESVDENGNVDVTDDFLFMPIMYEFEHPLTYAEYKTIRDNRTKAIGVSRSDVNHKSCFIMDMEYQITKGLATFKVALRENDPIV